MCTNWLFILILDFPIFSMVNGRASCFRSEHGMLCQWKLFGIVGNTFRAYSCMYTAIQMRNDVRTERESQSFSQKIHYDHIIRNSLSSWPTLMTSLQLLSPFYGSVVVILILVLQLHSVIFLMLDALSFSYSSEDHGDLCAF